MCTTFARPVSCEEITIAVKPNTAKKYFNKLIFSIVTLWLALAPDAEAQSKDEKIRDAMSAAPPSISGQATIRDRPSRPGGEMAVLREGSNGWTCFPDHPRQPGHSPACFDEVWMEVQRAMAQKRKPSIAKAGIAYLLQGGPPKSNIDPAATEATPDNEWIGPAQPPFVAIVFPDPAVLKNVSSNPDNGGPWVMWRDTPYVHLMIPMPKYSPEGKEKDDHITSNRD